MGALDKNITKLLYMQPDVEIAVFEDPPVSVPDEAECLSRDPLIDILRHIRNVQCGDPDYRTLKIWRTYKGVPLFLAEIRRELMIYAVENLGTDAQPVRKISVMFAGTRARGAVGNPVRWDGANDEVLWTAVVRPRCERHFK